VSFHLEAPVKENFREIQVKVHIRRPEKDSWQYLGRGVVTQEVTGQSSRVGESSHHCHSETRVQHVYSIVVRQLSGGKVMATFSEVIYNDSIHCMFRMVTTFLVV